MRCPSCGGATDSSVRCTECGLALAGQEGRENIEPDLLETPAIDLLSQNLRSEKRSTLIEFPGVERHSVPEWRKELSERVREVQEKRARNAAYEAAVVESQSLETLPSQPQLELLPQASAPTMNPLVAAALKRIERAHQSNPQTEQRLGRANVSTATALAYAPEREENDTCENDPISISIAHEVETPPIATEVDVTPSKAEKSHNGLMVVPTPTLPMNQSERAPAPKRLIHDDPNDPALNYLDSISKEILVEESAHRPASVLRRLGCAVLDLGIAALLCSPVIVAIKLTSNDFHDVRVLGISLGVFVIVTFLYLTMTIALTGRTWAMHLGSLRVIDLKTGMFPTGGQSAGRAFIYLLSLCTVGLGIVVALVSREKHTAHDRLTRTSVIAT